MFGCLCGHARILDKGIGKSHRLAHTDKLSQRFDASIAKRIADFERGASVKSLWINSPRWAIEAELFRTLCVESTPKEYHSIAQGNPASRVTLGGEWKFDACPERVEQRPHEV
jgi:hypothetical protein